MNGSEIGALTGALVGLAGAAAAWLRARAQLAAHVCRVVPVSPKGNTPASPAST